MNVRNWIKRMLVKRENRKYEKLLQSRKTAYGTWVTELEHRQRTRTAAVVEPERDCDFVIISASEGTVAIEAYEIVRKYFIEHPEVRLLYGDEDVCDGIRQDMPISAENRRLPWFKPDWSPDLFDSFFYFGSITAIRAELFQTLYIQDVSCADMLKPIETETVRGSVLYKAVDLEWYKKWMYTCVSAAGGYRRGSRSIGHLSAILFHCESEREQEKFLQELFGPGGDRKPVKQYRGRDDWTKADDSNLNPFRPLVSVVIPSKDQPGILEVCIKGCLSAAIERRNGAIPLEIIVVDNGSSEENQVKIVNLVQKLNSAGRRITYLYLPQEFHFSRMCNLGAAQAEGDFLLFLNDDVELIQPGCIEKMATAAGRENTGAVGLKLYYPGSTRIQHRGITNLPMGPVHKLQFLEDNRRYYYGANRGRHNVLAVTAACLMVKKEKYLEAGGFSEELRIAFNDVDFCFSLYELGYHNVCMNDLYAYHHESLSRGADESPEKLNRLLGERETLYRRHPKLEGADPYYSSHLNGEYLDTGIRPAYLTAGNVVQKNQEQLSFFTMKKYLLDSCLVMRVEDCRGRRIVGYGVVLGDNNACYERKLLLWKMGAADIEVNANFSDMEIGPREEIYALRLTEQYRPDLEQNMPDQVNVALGGFDVELGESSIPEGSYRLGMAVRNKISRLKLINWSNRILKWQHAAPSPEK